MLRLHKCRRFCMQGQTPHTYCESISAPRFAGIGCDDSQFRWAIENSFRFNICDLLQEPVCIETREQELRCHGWRPDLKWIWLINDPSMRKWPWHLPPAISQHTTFQWQWRCRRILVWMVWHCLRLCRAAATVTRTQHECTRDNDWRKILCFVWAPASFCQHCSKCVLWQE